MFSRKITQLILVGLAVFCCLSFLQAEADTPIVIKAGKLVDVENGKVLENQMILVEKDIITAVGPSLEVPEGATEVDLSDSIVMPGLIDCHVHVDGEASGDHYRTMFQRSFVDNAVVAHIYAKRTLDAGFTTVRSLGSQGFIDIALRNAINRGAVPGPRIQACGFYISATGGHGDLVGFSPWLTTVMPPEMSGIADGVDAVRKKVRYLVKNGADVIKFGASAGVLSGEESVGAPQYSQEEMNAIVDEAHMWEKKVAAHAHGTEAIKMAIKAGVDSVEHGSMIDAEGIQMMIENGTYLVADIYNDDYIVSEYSKMGAPDQIIEKEKLVGRTQRENFQKAVQAGVKVAFGTDAGVYPHGWNGKQFAKMVKWGLTPMQAIQAATVSSADLLGWSDTVGSISKGKFADIVAVKGDPMEDISVMEKVSFVMKGGTVYKTEAE